MLAFYRSFSRWPYYFHIRHGGVRSTLKSPLALRHCAISLRFHVQTTCYQDSDSYLRITWADDGKKPTSMIGLICGIDDAMNGYRRDNTRTAHLAPSTSFVATLSRNHKRHTRRGRCVCTQRPLVNVSIVVGYPTYPASKSQPDHSPIYTQHYTQSYAKPTHPSMRSQKVKACAAAILAAHGLAWR